MTKRKAIEAAMKRLRKEADLRAVRDERGNAKYEGAPLPGSVMREMETLWEQARIAALREAANAARGSSGSGLWISVMLLTKARELAKKARAK